MLDYKGDGDEDIPILNILNNFCKSEEGIERMQNNQKGIDKCMELLMKHNDKEEYQHLGGQILGKISKEDDLQKAIKSIEE